MRPIPHNSIDAVVIGSQIVSTLQSIVARNVDPLELAVVSVTWFHAGDAFNVLPQSATLKGTVRTFKVEVQDLVEQRLKDVATGVAAMHGATATVEYNRGYPCTSNHPEQTAFATEVAGQVSGPDKVNPDFPPGHGRQGFFLHAAGARPARSSSSATATRQACTTRPMISMTGRSPSASAIGRDWSRLRCRRLRSGKAWGFAKHKFRARRLAHQRKRPERGHAPGDQFDED